MIEIRAALLDDYGYVINTIIVYDLNFMPNLVEATDTGTIGDYWDGTNFIRPWDPAFPPHP